MDTGPLASAVFCPRCGEKRPVGARYCASCGLDLAHGMVAILEPEPVASPALVGQPAPLPAPPPPPGAPAGPAQAPLPPAPLAAVAAPPVAAPFARAAPVPAAGIYPTAGTFPTAGTIPTAGTMAPGSSAVGRRAGRRGWVGVLVGTLAFFAVAVALLVAAGVTRVSTAPLARWDTLLYDGSTISDGGPFTIEVEVTNPGTTPTDALWMVIEWRPTDRVSTPGAIGTVRACVPATCRFRDDLAAGSTIVWWPGLAPGTRHTATVTVAVSGLDAGGTFRYRVTTGSGPDERTVRGGHRWDLDLDVQ